MGDIQGMSASALFELGKLYCDRGDFQLAIQKLEPASSAFFQQKDFNGYLKSQNLLLRIFAEMEDSKNLYAIKERIQDLVIRESVDLTAKTYYTLALCANHKGQHKMALEYLEKSLALALGADSKEDICYAIGGLAIVYFALGRYEDSLKEIYNLKVFFQILDLPELRLYSLLLNGNVLRKMGNHEEALELYWQCYEILKTQKNLYFYVLLLHAIGMAYSALGDLDLAKVYLNLADKAADPENLKYCSRKIKEALENIGAPRSDEYDIVFEASANSVIEKKRGRVDFKNQFILLDLFRLFVRHPGEVYSKESLVKKVWKQEYDPQVHDNKIYVTIKRLRKMIEPDFDKPKYIFRAKNGYYMNKNTKVLFEQ